MALVPYPCCQTPICYGVGEFLFDFVFGALLSFSAFFFKDFGSNDPEELTASYR